MVARRRIELLLPGRKEGSRPLWNFYPYPERIQDQDFLGLGRRPAVSNFGFDIRSSKSLDPIAEHALQIFLGKFQITLSSVHSGVSE